MQSAGIADVGIVSKIANSYDKGTQTDDTAVHASAGAGSPMLSLHHPRKSSLMEEAFTAAGSPLRGQRPALPYSAMH